MRLHGFLLLFIGMMVLAFLSFVSFHRQNQVIAIDINPRRIKCARHNAMVYGVAHRIDFIVGDFFGIAPSLKVCFFFKLLGSLVHSQLQGLICMNRLMCM